MPPATAKRLARDIPPLRAPHAPPDEVIARDLLAGADRSSDAEARIDARARRLVGAIRARPGGLGGVEDFLHAYSLTTKEGLALMVLAEALLRVPDAETADRLIEDKLKAGDWAHHEARSTSLLVSASACTLGVTARVIHPGETPEGIVDTLVKRLGLPAVRAATRQAMRLLGSHFVLGQRIEERAIARQLRIANFSTLLTCWAKALVVARMPKDILSFMLMPLMRLVRPQAMRPCRSALAFP